MRLNTDLKIMFIPVYYWIMCPGRGLDLHRFCKQPEIVIADILEDCQIINIKQKVFQNVTSSRTSIHFRALTPEANQLLKCVSTRLKFVTCVAVEIRVDLVSDSQSPFKDSLKLTGAICKIWQ